jgi:hypothetical protein
MIGDRMQQASSRHSPDAGSWRPQCVTRGRSVRLQGREPVIRGICWAVMAPAARVRQRRLTARPPTASATTGPWRAPRARRPRVPRRLGVTTGGRLCQFRLLLSDPEAVAQGRTSILQEARLASPYPKCAASISSAARRLPAHPRADRLSPGEPTAQACFVGLTRPGWSSSC